MKGVNYKYERFYEIFARKESFYPKKFFEQNFDFNVWIEFVTGLILQNILRP